MKGPDGKKIPDSIINKARPLFRTKRNYIQVPQDRRGELLSYIETHKTTIKEASSRLKINYSTAKFIVKQYRQNKMKSIGKEVKPEYKRFNHRKGGEDDIFLIGDEQQQQLEQQKCLTTGLPKQNLVLPHQEHQTLKLTINQSTFVTNSQNPTEISSKKVKPLEEGHTIMIEEGPKQSEVHAILGKRNYQESQSFGGGQQEQPQLSQLQKYQKLSPQLQQLQKMNSAIGKQSEKRSEHNESTLIYKVQPHNSGLQSVQSRLSQVHQSNPTFLAQIRPSGVSGLSLATGNNSKQNPQRALNHSSQFITPQPCRTGDIQRGIPMLTADNANIGQLSGVDPDETFQKPTQRMQSSQFAPRPVTILQPVRSTSQFNPVKKSELVNQKTKISSNLIRLQDSRSLSGLPYAAFQKSPEALEQVVRQPTTKVPQEESNQNLFHRGILNQNRNLTYPRLLTSSIQSCHQSQQSPPKAARKVHPIVSNLTQIDLDDEGDEDSSEDHVSNNDADDTPALRLPYVSQIENSSRHTRQEEEVKKTQVVPGPNLVNLAAVPQKKPQVKRPYLPRLSTNAQDVRDRGESLQAVLKRESTLSISAGSSSNKSEFDKIHDKSKTKEDESHPKGEVKQRKAHQSIKIVQSKHTGSIDNHTQNTPIFLDKVGGPLSKFSKRTIMSNDKNLEVMSKDPGNLTLQDIMSQHTLPMEMDAGQLKTLIGKLQTMMEQASQMLSQKEKEPSKIGDSKTQDLTATLPLMQQSVNIESVKVPIQDTFSSYLQKQEYQANERKSFISSRAILLQQNAVEPQPQGINRLIPSQTGLKYPQNKDNTDDLSPHHVVMPSELSNNLTAAQQQLTTQTNILRLQSSFGQQVQQQQQHQQQQPTPQQSSFTANNQFPFQKTPAVSSLIAPVQQTSNLQMPHLQLSTNQMLPHQFPTSLIQQQLLQPSSLPSQMNHASLLGDKEKMQLITDRTKIQLNTSTANLPKVETTLTLKQYNGSSTLINPIRFQGLPSQSQLVQAQPSPLPQHSGSNPHTQGMCSQNQTPNPISQT